MIVIFNLKSSNYLKYRLIFLLISLILIGVLFSTTTYAAAPYSKDQLKVLNDINELRKKMGLPQVELDKDLSNAATDHSIYLFANDKIGHTQNQNLYRTHKYFNERIEQYTGEQYYKSKGWHMIAEDVDYRSPAYAVRDLVEAPYHRYPITHPQLTHIGVGSIGYHNTVITFGIAQSKNYIEYPLLYPYNNETNVLLSQKVFENPDPFDDTPMSQEEAGYVLSIFTGEIVQSTSLNISLYDENNNPVEFIVKSLTPSEGSDFWLVIPTKKLEPLTTYIFKVNGSTSHFTTMSEQEFNEWDTYREEAYVPYKEDRIYFDKLIAELNNFRFNSNLTHNNEESSQETIHIPKKSLPTTFEQRGYSRDNIGIYLNEGYINLNPSAKIKDNRTFIPLRGILESLDANVHYNSSSKVITVTQGDLIIRLLPYSNNVEITEGSLTIIEELDTKPFVENGSTFVPLRFLSQTLGAEIVWDQSSFTVGIGY